MSRNDRHLTREQLVTRIDEDVVDTVIVAFTDMQGRLAGQAAARRRTSGTRCCRTAPRAATTSWVSTST